MERHLAWPDLLNARDLGGIRSASGTHTTWRRVVRADNLNKARSRGSRGAGRLRSPDGHRPARPA
ncbi:MAG: tyrosine-protein phosphatase [Candidatus Limnocylindria bacterium]